jgi:hypothetical protein
MGKVVRYEFPIVAQCVLAAREPDYSIKKICEDQDPEITPKILNLWCQQYSRCSKDSLKRLLAVYSIRGGGSDGNLVGVGSINHES